MRHLSIWETLGISRTQDRTEIRRAYAKKLKVTNPEDDPEGFKALRSAYEEAMIYVELPDGDTPAPQPPDDREAERFDTSAVANWEHLQDIRFSAGNRPAPALSDLAKAYGAAREHLEATLSVKASADDNDRLEALYAVLAAPALGSTAESLQAETWLTRLIIENTPQSDILIAPFINHFGWRSEGPDEWEHDKDSYRAREQILKRGRDLAFLNRIQRPDTNYHYAYTILSQPRQRESLRSRLFSKTARDDIQEFLEMMRRSHPDIETELNAETVALWERRFERPGLSGVDSWMIALSLPCLLLIILATFSPEVFGAVLLVCCVPPMWTCCWLVSAYGFARPRLWWSKQEKWRANSWLAFGWGPTIIALFFLAAMPQSVELTMTVIALALWVVWWAVTTGEPDRNSEKWVWSFRVLFSEIFLVLWSLVIVARLPAAGQMTISIFAAAVVSGFGRMPLLHRWNGFTRTTQRAVLITLLGLTAIAVIALWLSRYNDDQEVVAIAIAAAVILLHRVPALKAQGPITVWQIVTILGTFLATGSWRDDNVVPAVGSVILGWAALSCIISLKASPEKLSV